MLKHPINRRHSHCSGWQVNTVKTNATAKIETFFLIVLDFSTIFVRLLAGYGKITFFIAFSVSVFNRGLPARVAGRPHG
jgi:hypothetical protein